MVTNTLRTSVIAAMAILFVTTAHAAPLLNQGNMRPTVSLAEKARIVCQEDGRCYRPRGRRPVARWVYGDDAFHGPGPYVGPGYYGNPAFHYGWWFFGW